MNTKNLVIDGHTIDIQEIQKLISQKKELHATKFLMDHYGFGLTKASKIIEEIVQDMIPLSPEEQVDLHIRDLLREKMKNESTNHRQNSDRNFGDHFDSQTTKQNLDELFEGVKGKKITKFSGKTETLDQFGNLKERQSFKKIIGLKNSQKEKGSLFIDDSKANIKKLIIFYVLAIIFVIYFLSQR